METKNVVNWLLLISTFLVAGKALKLLDISWIIAFGPVALLTASYLFVFMFSFIYLYKTVFKNNDEDGKKD